MGSSPGEEASSVEGGVRKTPVVQGLLTGAWREGVDGGTGALDISHGSRLIGFIHEGISVDILGEDHLL